MRDPTTTHHYRARLMRDHAAFVAENGDGWNDFKVKELQRFYRKLVNYVVEHDPSIAPYKGCTTGGWRYVARTSGDGRLMFRQNEYSRTDLSESELELWSLP